VDRRVSMAVRICIFGLVRCPWGNLARISSVGCLWYMEAEGEAVCLIVSRLLHL
jgi:hypothetical protein